MTLDYEKLAQLPALAGFTPPEIDAFFAICERLSIAAGERLIRAGDAADCFFLLAKGTLEVIVETNGKPMPVAQLNRGQLVGEMPLIYSQPVRQADVVATEACNLMRWSYADYEQLGQREPALIKKFRSNLGKIVASRAWTTPTAPARPGSPASPSTQPGAVGRPAVSIQQPGGLPLRAGQMAGSGASENSTHQVLKRATTFAGFADDELRQLETIAQVFTVGQHQVVCTVGDPAESFFVIASGNVEVQIEKNGKHFPLARLGPGQVFGEMALVYKQPTRSATVVAVEPSKLLRIGFADYNALAQDHPEIGRKLRNNLSRVAASRAWSLPEADEAKALKQRERGT